MCLEVAPENGGSIVSLRRGEQILMQGRPSEPHLACFPMLPYCNRIARGRFVFQGLDVVLAPNFSSEANTIHGTAWQAPWQVTSKTADELHLSYDHDAVSQRRQRLALDFARDANLQTDRRRVGDSFAGDQYQRPGYACGVRLAPVFPCAGSDLFNQSI